jgi:hypothetical protein
MLSDILNMPQYASKHIVITQTFLSLAVALSLRKTKMKIEICNNEDVEGIHIFQSYDGSLWIALNVQKWRAIIKEAIKK